MTVVDWEEEQYLVRDLAAVILGSFPMLSVTVQDSVARAIDADDVSPADVDCSLDRGATEVKVSADGPVVVERHVVGVVRSKIVVAAAHDAVVVGVLSLPIWGRKNGVLALMHMREKNIRCYFVDQTAAAHVAHVVAVCSSWHPHN
jgi:hypothetical protein